MTSNDTIVADSAISASAVAVAAAEVRLSRARAALEEADAAARRLRERITDLEAQRAAIVSRRKRGDHQDDDGPRLSLLGADLTGLADLEAEAASAVAAARAAEDTAEAAVSTTKANLSRAEAAAAVRLLSAHAAELEARLTETLALLRDRADVIGVRTPWRPSPGFYTEVRRAALAAGLV